MPADGTTVIRMYPFDPDTTTNSYVIAVYLEQATVDNTAYNGGAPEPRSTLYPELDTGIWYISDRQVGYDSGTNLRSFVTLVSDYYNAIPTGTEFVEVAFVPMVNGVATPIDPLAPPEEIFLFIDGHYAGGVVEVGAYVDGAYVVLGTKEYSDYGGFYGFGEDAVALTAPEPASCPPFWQAFLRSKEIDLCASTSPTAGDYTGRLLYVLDPDTQTLYTYGGEDTWLAIGSASVGSPDPYSGAFTKNHYVVATINGVWVSIAQDAGEPYLAFFDKSLNKLLGGVAPTNGASNLVGHFGDTLLARGFDKLTFFDTTGLINTYTFPNNFFAYAQPASSSGDANNPEILVNTYSGAFLRAFDSAGALSATVVPPVGSRFTDQASPGTLTSAAVMYYVEETATDVGTLYAVTSTGSVTLATDIPYKAAFDMLLVKAGPTGGFVDWAGGLDYVTVGNVPVRVSDGVQMNAAASTIAAFNASDGYINAVWLSPSRLLMRGQDVYEAAIFDVPSNTLTRLGVQIKMAHVAAKARGLAVFAGLGDSVYAYEDATAQVVDLTQLVLGGGPIGDRRFDISPDTSDPLVDPANPVYIPPP